MASTISWLDSTPEEQRVARELIALFSQSDSRDELGIGQIRDAFSDLLFPGTSVIQTRARYYLFVPWCYTAGKAAGTFGSANRKQGEAQERQLIKTLRDANLEDAAGLIGSRVGPSVKTLPSTIFWSGMSLYGVRTHNGGIGSLNVRSVPTDGATELSDRAITEWDPGLPPPPSDFPHAVPRGFALERTEAEWLRDRILAATPDSALAYILDQGALLGDDIAHPWQAAPTSAFEEMHHAEWFSTAIEGASLLYNLLVAERYEAAGYDRIERPVDDYRKRIASWESRFQKEYGDGLEAWDVARMWQLTTAKNPNISHARSFVDHWIAGLRTGLPLLDNARMIDLVRTREKRKAKQSRLLNDKMLATWSGSSGVGRLNFRWGTVKTIVNDIVHGLADDAAA